MSRALRYHVTATAPQVVRAIEGSSSRDPSLFAFGVADQVETPLVGGTSADGSFDLRRPRGFTTAPRVLVLRGRVTQGDVGAHVVARFEFHPAVRATIAVSLLVALLFVGATAPGIPRYPELIWVPITMSVIVLLFCVPFVWFARYDRASLRTELEAALCRAGLVTKLEDPSTSV